MEKILMNNQNKLKKIIDEVVKAKFRIFFLNYKG